MKTLIVLASLALASLPFARQAHADYCQAAPAPTVGQVIPCAVQTPAGSPSYIYSVGYTPGDLQAAGAGSLVYVLDQEIALGWITRDQAAQSWDNTPAVISGGGANPFR